jgi:predicted ATP-grasp superfamily ATP-dependent carboligase
MLAACRGLAAGGYEVAAAGFGSLAPTRWSRSCSEYVRVRDPRADAGGFVADLAAYLARRPCEIVIPGSDFSLLAISSYRAQLDGLANLGLPTHDVVEKSLDRESLARAAARAGLRPPPWIRCDDLDAATAAAEKVGLPLLVKSCRVARLDGARIVTGRRTAPANTPAELGDVLRAGTESFLIQQWVVGQTVSFGGVMAGGDLLGGCLARYERTWPPRAGNAAYALTIEIAPELERAIISLLTNIGWRGIFELELMRDDDGSLLAIDFNPRPYGSMALSIMAGANLPVLWGEWLGGGTPSATRATAGRRYRREDADLLNLLWQAHDGNVATVRRILRPSRAVVHPHFQSNDPLPLVVRVVSLAHRAFRRRGSRPHRSPQSALTTTLDGARQRLTRLAQRRQRYPNERPPSPTGSVLRLAVRSRCGRARWRSRPSEPSR